MAIVIGTDPDGVSDCTAARVMTGRRGSDRLSALRRNGHRVSDVPRQERGVVNGRLVNEEVGLV